MDLPFGPFQPDVADYGEGVCLKAENCIRVANGYREIPSGSIRDSDLDTTGQQCVGAGVYERADANQNYQILVSEDAGVPAKVTIHAAVGWALGPWDVTNLTAPNWRDSFWFVDMIQYDDQLLFFGACDPPQKIAVSSLSGGNTADIGGSPPALRTIARVGQFLVGGSVYGGNQNRVQWSAFDDYEGWTAGTDQSGFEDMKEELGEVYRVFGGDYGIIFQQGGVTRMDYIGLPDIWRFEQIEAAQGLLSPRGAVQVGSDIYYLSPSGFMVLRDGVGVEPIGANKIDDWFFGQIGADFTDTSYTGFDAFQFNTAAYDPISDTVWWNYSVADDNYNGAGFSELSNQVIYNRKTGEWTTAAITMNQLFSGIPGLRSDDVVGKHAFGYVASAASENNQYFLEGTALAATIETGTLVIPGSKSEVSEVRGYIEGSHTVTVLTKDDLPSDSETSDGPHTPDSSGKVDPRAEGRFHRLRFVTSGSFGKAQGCDVVIKPSGNR